MYLFASPLQISARYTNNVKAGACFSTEVDQQVFDAANLGLCSGSACICLLPCYRYLHDIPIISKQVPVFQQKWISKCWMQQI